jgi:hypothetical protein
MLRKKKQFVPTHLQVVLGIVGLIALGGMGYAATNTKTSIDSYAESEQTTSIQVSATNGDVNEDGGSYSESGDLWIGNGVSASASYSGIRFANLAIPKNASISDAHLEVYSTKDQWISLSYTISLSDVGSFDKKPSQASFVTGSINHSSNVKWNVNSWYSLDNMSTIFQNLVNRDDWNGSGNVMVVLKGTGNAYGRKYVSSYDKSAANAPKLVVKYQISPTTSTVSITPTPTKSSTPTVTKAATKTPTLSPTLTISPSNTVTSAPTETTHHVPTIGSTSIGGTVFGVVSNEIVGTCSQEIHDKYVVKGPDGVVYRTWHPQKDASGCSFAHEHGDNPAESAIYTGAPVAFGYVGNQIAMDEPHAGFKCFVHNKGTQNDEGGVALHDSYYCFHMGTGGAARFTQRFHSIEFHLKTNTGAIMNVQGMADTGNVGTICDNPRNARTVMAFGCKLDSSYEIWENTLKITNRGNTVATAITSTAAFDSITVMDPSDKTKAIPVWDFAAQQNIFKFNNDRTGYRGCDREAYSGPTQWYNRGGSQVYYTDVYGNVVNGGPLKQEISPIITSQAGKTDQFGGLIMAYKGGNASDPQLQFKYRKSSCAPGLGVKN